MDEQHIQYLIRQYRQDIITQQELEELSVLLMTDKHKALVQEVLRKEMEQHVTDPAFLDRDYRILLEKVIGVDHLKALQENDPLEQVSNPLVRVFNPDLEHPVHRLQFLKTSWFRYAAAVILIVGAGVLYFLTRHEDVATTNGNKHLRSDIAPGSNKAILTLADGNTIMLDSAHNGSLAQQGNTKIIKLTNGQLAYSPLQKEGGLAARSALYNTISTPKGGQYQIVLPDGTKVWLNAASSIKFPAAFVGDTRSVEMTGEAYMEIAKNLKHPFVVTANGVQIQVLGTSFNINAYPDEEAAKTTLIEGSVKVLKSNKEVLLKPGQQAVIKSSAQNDNVQMKVQAADISEVLAWKNGRFQFNNADLPTVLRQVARWYDLEVSYEGQVPIDRFEGKIPRGAMLSQVLSVLEKNNVHFRIEGKKLIVMP